MYAYEPDSGPMGMPNVFDNSKILRTPTGSPLYPIAQPVGKSSNQIGKKNDKLFANDKEVYDKWAQAISSAHVLVDDSVYERERLGFSDSFSVIFPVLIVPDDCLWCVDYDKEGKRLAEPKVTNETSFYISKEYWKKGQMHAAYTASHLHIMTFSGYKHFTGKIASNIRFWAEVYPPNNLAEKE